LSSEQVVVIRSVFRRSCLLSSCRQSPAWRSFYSLLFVVFLACRWRQLQPTRTTMLWKLWRPVDVSGIWSTTWTKSR